MSESFEELSWNEPEEKPKPLAPEEPFRPGMILIPVICSICRLRIYVQEKHAGFWTRCPDCGHLNEIRPVDPQIRQTAGNYRDGMNKPFPAETQKQRSPKKAERHYNVDYRNLEGAVDAGNEPIPFYGLDDTSSDPIENMMDRLIDKNPDARLSEPEKKYRRALSESACQKVAKQKQHETESAEERRQRLIEELNRQKSNQARTIPGNASAQNPPKYPSCSPADANSVKNSSTFEQNLALLQQAVEHDKTSLNKSSRKGGFGNILWDRRNFRRFFLLGLFGFITFWVFLTLDFYLTTSLSPESHTGYSFTIFYGLYVCAVAPLALWGILLMITGMTIFDVSRDGLSKVQQWIPFRIEFALQYLWVFLIISWTAPFPGTVLGLILAVTGLGEMFLPLKMASIPIFGTLSLFLFGPVLFLSIVESDCGIDLFNRKIWGSWVHQFGAWIGFYTSSLFFILLLTAVFGGVLFILHLSAGWKYLFVWPIHLGLGAVLSTAVELILLILFRLLGRLAWQLDQ